MRVYSRSFIAISDRRKSRRNAIARGLSANVESAESRNAFRRRDKICEKKKEYIWFFFFKRIITARVLKISRDRGISLTCKRPVGTFKGGR